MGAHGFGFRRSGGAVNGFSDPVVGTAAAEIPIHIGIDLIIGRFRILRQQGYSRHDLATLAVTALGHLFLHPGFLDGMEQLRGADAFNRGDLLFFL